MEKNNTLILFMSGSGTAEKAAAYLAEKLGGNSDLVNLRKQRPPALASYRRVIIGGSIRAGKIQKQLRSWVEKRSSELKTMELGLFLCCMEEGENAEKQFNEAYPEELRQAARATGLFGGAFDFDRLNFLEKGIIKKVAGVSEPVSKIDYEAIDKFAVSML